MKALSLTQPWATLIAIGAKRYETRSWKTSFRGTIAIAASKRYPIDAFRFSRDYPARQTLGNVAIPIGCIVAIADISQIYPTGSLFSTTSLPDAAEHEEEFGNYAPGRFAWKLDNVRKLRVPVLCKGALSLWEVPSDVEAEVRAQL